MQLPFWLTCFAGMMVYIGVCNAVNVSYSALMTRFHFDEETAGTLFNLPYIVSAIISLPVGWVIEKYGLRTTLALTGSIVMFCCHAI